MLKKSIKLIVTALSACSVSSPVARDPLQNQPFRLCNQTRQPWAIALDYRSLRGVFVDYGRDILTCGDASNCISFPVVFAIPPRIPEAGETVRWSTANYVFLMQRMANSEEDYDVRATVRPGATRVTANPGVQYHYNLRRGLTIYHELGQADSWTQCSGRLTFEDLRRLRPRLVPEFRHNPNLTPDWPNTVNAPLDANISIAVPR